MCRSDPFSDRFVTVSESGRRPGLLSKGDAGATRVSGHIVPPDTTRIVGAFKNGTDTPFGPLPVDVDVFGFGVTDVVTLTISARSPDLDVNLLLLDEGFLGIWGDDDSGGGPGMGTDSQITVKLFPGMYYLAVGVDNIAAYAAGATKVDQQVWNNDSGELADPETTIPVQFVGTMDESPMATTGQSYEVTINLPTDAAGLDLSIGQGFQKQVGVGIVNDNAAGQTINSLQKKAKAARLILRNNGARRNAGMRVAGADDSEFRFTVTEIDGSDRMRNVTGAVRTGKHAVEMIEFERVRYNVKVTPKDKFARVRGSLSFAVRDLADVRFGDRVRVTFKLGS